MIIGVLPPPIASGIGLNLKGVDTRAFRSTLRPASMSRCASRIAQEPANARAGFGDGRGIITQSLSILVLSRSKYPKPRLMPVDPWLGARLRSFATTIATDIHPLNNTSVLTRPSSSSSADEDHVGEWYRHWIKLGFNALEHQVANPGTPSTCLATNRRWLTLCNVGAANGQCAPFRQISRRSRVLSRDGNPRGNIRLSSNGAPKIRRTL